MPVRHDEFQGFVFLSVKNGEYKQSPLPENPGGFPKDRGQITEELKHSQANGVIQTL